MMSTTDAAESGEAFIVVSALDDTGTMTVEGSDGTRYEVTAFGDELLRERVKTLSPGSAARLSLTERVDGGSGVRLTRLLPGTPVGPFGAD